MAETKKYYVVVVEEVSRRRVIIKCDPDYEAWDAESAAEDLCDNGTINLDGEDFQERCAKALHEATHEELARLNIYEA